MNKLTKKAIFLFLKCFFFVFVLQFSQDQFILDGPSEKLRRELEEELKMNCEEPRSHAWYHGAIPRQVSRRQTLKQSLVPLKRNKVTNSRNEISN